MLASRFCSTYASRAPLWAIVISSDAPSKAKRASVLRPSTVTSLSSPVLTGPPLYTIDRLSGFHANVVIGIGLVSNSFGFPAGCGAIRSSYVPPFSQRRKASHRPSGENAGETSWDPSGPSVTGCSAPPATGYRYSRSAKAAFDRYTATSAWLSGVHVRNLRAPGSREPGRLEITCSGPPSAGT